jgi:hypothetical protein
MDGRGVMEVARKIMDIELLNPAKDEENNASTYQRFVF